MIGRPNVGKSSLINYIAGEERSIVTDIAGTTRDAIDTEIKNRHGDFVFIDTAGIRRRSKIDSRVEYYSVLRAEMAVERADVRDYDRRDRGVYRAGQQDCRNGA